jgi:choline monooxygenase
MIINNNKIFYKKNWLFQKNLLKKKFRNICIQINNNKNNWIKKSFLNNKLLIEEIKKWNPNIPINNATTPPSTWYIQPEFLTLESKSVFFQNWIPVGRIEQLKEKGSFISGNILGESYIVIRDLQNQLKAFFNVCRHHATRLISQDCGKINTGEIVCPYHGWTYTLEGNLKKATQIRGIENFNSKNNSLFPIHVQTFGLWVFIHLGLEPQWTLEKCSLLEKMLYETNYQDLKYYISKTYTVNCNWKIFIDNYCDGGYHVPYLHKTLNSQIEMNSYKTILDEKFSIQTCSGKKNINDEMLKNKINENTIYAFIYPNFMINRYRDVMDTNTVIPISIDKTLVHFDFFFKDIDSKEAKDYINYSLKISDKIQQEDADISSLVQQGIESSSFDVGRYAPNVEQAAHHFHKLLWNDFMHFLKE